METVHLACFPKDQDVEGEVLEDLVVQVCRKCRLLGAGKRVLNLFNGVKPGIKEQNSRIELEKEKDNSGSQNIISAL